MVLIEHKYGYSFIPDKKPIKETMQVPPTAPDSGYIPPLTAEADEALGHFLGIRKGSVNVVPSFYDVEDVPISNKERPGRTDVTDTDAIRRAIHTISNYYNTLGVYRDDFDKNLNDKLARNAYYALCEKAILDYLGSAEYKATT